MSTTAELTQELKQVKTDVDDHDKFINGNGKQGAKERLALLEKRDEDLICKIASVDNKINWLIGVVVSLFTITLGINITVGTWLLTDFVPKVMQKLQ